MTKDLLARDRELVDLPIDRLFFDWDFNCRGFIHRDDVLDLIPSMRDHGLQSPILVRPATDGRYQIVSGYRRGVAAQALGWTSIPAFIYRGLDDTAALAWNLQENIIRRDLNILQEAQALQRIFATGATLEEAAKKVNHSVPWVATRRDLLSLPEEVQAAAAAGRISQQDIRDIYRAGPRRHGEKFRAIQEKRAARTTVMGRTPGKANAKYKPGSGTKVPGVGWIETRTEKEISDMANHVRNSVDCPLAMRALAWTCGYLSDQEFFEFVAELAREQGRPYERPHRPCT